MLRQKPWVSAVFDGFWRFLVRFGGFFSTTKNRQFCPKYQPKPMGFGGFWWILVFGECFWLRLMFSCIF
jgi:hypothetical protein